MLNPALEKCVTERDQRQAFRLGCHPTNKGAAIYQSYFRHKLFDKHITEKIFSYIHAEMPVNLKELKEEKQYFSLNKRK